MPDWLTHPQALIVILCLGTLILGLNASLLGLLRGNTKAWTEAAKWGQVLRGGPESRQRQAAQLDELHQAVSQFKSGTSQDKSDD